MIMVAKTIVFLVWLTVLSKHILCEQNDHKPLGKFLYEDLKCSPVKENSTSSTITAFTCGDLTDKKRCIFEGKQFQSGEDINDNGTDVYCRSSCSCNGEGSFECSEYDCNFEVKPGCRQKYTLTECCPKEVCEPPKLNCTFNGKIYSEGTTFSAGDNLCTTCICEKGFTGKIEEPYCIKKRCLEQVFNMESLSKNCAAVYYSRDLCCPTTWVCNEKQKIVKISSNDSHPELSCIFGEDKVPYGYGFETTVRPYSKIVKVKCECSLPPFVTCLEV